MLLLQRSNTVRRVRPRTGGRRSSGRDLQSRTGRERRVCRSCLCRRDRHRTRRRALREQGGRPFRTDRLIACAERFVVDGLESHGLLYGVIHDGLHPAVGSARGLRTPILPADADEPCSDSLNDGHPSLSRNPATAAQPSPHRCSMNGTAVRW